MARLTGQWQTAGARVDFIGKRLTPTATKAMREAGDRLVEVIQGHIDAQDLPWVPLSNWTIRVKNGDTRKYIFTGDLRGRGFKVRQLKASKRGSKFFVGANPWTRHVTSGLKMNELMTILEYGTVLDNGRAIPPRPLIKPSYDEFKKDFPKKFSKYMSTELGLQK